MQIQNTTFASFRRSYGLVSAVLSAASAGAMILAPRQTSRYLSLPTNARLVRSLAARDLFIGATLLNETLRQRGLAMRGIADATDAALILAGGGRSSPASKVKAALALAGAVGALTLALIAGRAKRGA